MKPSVSSVRSRFCVGHEESICCSSRSQGSGVLLVLRENVSCRGSVGSRVVPRTWGCPPGPVLSSSLENYGAGVTVRIQHVPTARSPVRPSVLALSGPPSPWPLPDAFHRQDLVLSRRSCVPPRAHPGGCAFAFRRSHQQRARAPVSRHRPQHLVASLFSMRANLRGVRASPCGFRGRFPAVPRF